MVDLSKLCEKQFIASQTPVYKNVSWLTKKMLLQCWLYLFWLQSEIMEDYFCIFFLLLLLKITSSVFFPFCIKQALKVTRLNHRPSVTRSIETRNILTSWILDVVPRLGSTPRCFVAKFSWSYRECG